ncbi:Sorting nexin mvp1 [Mycoemilia scoparia]|uniref:Sorting nexin MVP1 n=1 Tax=Mycoemilia scoparia TaxID=417184 RepID=A0A9W8A361_9FUNG|nr:Sorting nexin mvp1 [Mycoemilia scoparia]
MFNDNPWGAADPTPQFTTPDLRSSFSPDVSRLSHDIPPQHYALFTEVSGGMGWVTAESIKNLLVSAGLQARQAQEILTQVGISLENPATLPKFSIAVSLGILAQNDLPPTIDTLEQYRDELPELKINENTELSDDSHNKDSDDEFGDMVHADKAPIAGAATAAVGNMSLNNINSKSKTESEPLENKRQNLSVEAPKRPQSRSAKTSMSEMSVVSEVESHEDQELDQWKLDKEVVTVKEAKEKGGVLFKHVNYDITTKIYGSHVVRRYNDFFWLSEYMCKKYPYRMLPNIPPKGFPDNRILGLNRFSNAILRTPFLRADKAVQAFFKNSEELSRIIKSSNFYPTPERPDIKTLRGQVNAERAQRVFSSLDNIAKKVNQDEATYRIQIISQEKIARYSQAIGEEMYSISNATRQHNVPREANGGPSDIPEGIKSVLSSARTKAMRVLRENVEELSMHFGNTSLLEKAKGEVIRSVTAEHLRRYHDTVVSLKNLIERLKEADKMPAIDRANDRIQNLREQLGKLQNQPDTSISSIEKINSQLKTEFQTLDGLNYELELMQLRFYQELKRYDRSLAFLGTIYSQHSEDQIKHHNLMLNAWKQALDAAKHMPTNPLDYV